MTTIYDVAALAEVSPKTVSRVINDSKLVKPDTREKVLAAIRESDYHPNAVAKSLKEQKSGNIGYVIPYGSDFVFRDPGQLEQMKGVSDTLTASDYAMLLSVPKTNQEVLYEVSSLLKHKKVDGLLLYAVKGVEPFAKEFETKGLKYVSLGKCYPEQKNNFVEVDAPYGGYIGTKFLLDLGHRRICFLGEALQFLEPAKESMITGCRRAYLEMGLDFPDHLVIQGDYTMALGYLSAKRFLEMDPRPTAFFCASDPMAWGVIKALREQGITPGQGVDVLAGDNLPLTQNLEPGLSTVNSRLYEMGAMAAEMLLLYLSGDLDNNSAEFSGKYLQSELVIRQTTNGPGVGC